MYIFSKKKSCDSFFVAIPLNMMDESDCEYNLEIIRRSYCSQCVDLLQWKIFFFK